MLSFIAFLLIVLSVIGFPVFGIASLYINGKEEWQDERTCTVDTAYKHSSGGGFRMGGSSQKIIIESPDCGKIFLRGVLPDKTREETVQYLEEHQGEEFRFYFGKIQIKQLNSDALLARRIQLIE